MLASAAPAFVPVTVDAPAATGEPAPFSDLELRSRASRSDEALDWEIVGHGRQAAGVIAVTARANRIARAAERAAS
jgi:hypothetical protein